MTKTLLAAIMSAGMLLAACEAPQAPPTAMVGSEAPASLVTALRADLQDFHAGRFKESYRNMPSRLLAAKAAQADLTEEQYVDQEVREISLMLQEMQITEVSYGYNNINAFQTASGQPFYTVPMRVGMIAMGIRVTANAVGIAFQEDGRWVFFDPEDSNDQRLFNQVYPEFAGVQLPPMKLSVQ